MYASPSPFYPHQIFNASLFTEFYIKTVSASLDPALVRWWLEVHIYNSTRFWCQSLHSLCTGIQRQWWRRAPVMLVRAVLAQVTHGESQLTLLWHLIWCVVTWWQKRNRLTLLMREQAVSQSSPQKRPGTQFGCGGRQGLPLETLREVFSPLGRQWCLTSCLKPQVSLQADWISAGDSFGPYLTPSKEIGNYPTCSTEFHRLFFASACLPFSSLVINIECTRGGNI